MDSQHYSWIVRNKYSYSGPRALGAGVADRLLRKTAQDAGNRARASAAWERAAPPELLAASQVEAFKDGRLTVCVDNSLMLQGARLNHRQLHRALHVLLPTLRRVHFVPRGLRHD